MTPQLEIIKAAPVSTIQDLGRFGFQRYGVTQSGPMDSFAFSVANTLLQNDANAAMIEFAGFGGHYKLIGDHHIQFCVTGADVPVLVNGNPFETYQVITLNSGDVLEIGVVRSGNYGYLALRGGIEIDSVIGSLSTHSRAGFGGFDGRKLAPHDHLPLTNTPIINEVRLAQSARLKPSDTINVILGQQANMFSTAEVGKFLSQAYKISNRLDRMGVFLDGTPLVHKAGHDLVSDGIVTGSIQVPGNGLPIVLMADRQPTGGYPKIATITTADLPKFAQLPPGSDVHFNTVTLDQATTDLAKYSTLLNTIALQFQPVIKTENQQAEALMKANLISGVVSQSD